MSLKCHSKPVFTERDRPGRQGIDSFQCLGIAGGEQPIGRRLRGGQVTQRHRRPDGIGALNLRRGIGGAYRSAAGFDRDAEADDAFLRLVNRHHRFTGEVLWQMKCFE